LNGNFFDEILSIEHDFPKSGLHVKRGSPPPSLVGVNDVVRIGPRIRNGSGHLNWPVGLYLSNGVVLFRGETLRWFLLIHELAESIYYKHVSVW